MIMSEFNRPIYETEATLSAERLFAEKIQGCWRCTLDKLPRKYGIDFMARRNGILAAWVELKCRTTYRTQYAEYMLSLDKWMHGRAIARDTGAPFLLAVRFTDCDMFLDCNDTIQIKIGFQGRTRQTRDWQDIEPCVFIPMRNFRKLP